VARIVFIVYGVEGKTFILLVTRIACGGVVFGKARLPVFIPCVLFVPSVSVVRLHCYMYFITSFVDTKVLNYFYTTKLIWYFFTFF